MITGKMQADRILKLGLADIERLPPKQRAWLTQVYRGNISSNRAVQDRYREARDHLHRIGYLPATDKARRLRDAEIVAALEALPDDIDPLIAKAQRLR
jgi:hypothetical protein